MPCGFNSASSERGSPFHSLGFTVLKSLFAMIFCFFKAHRSATSIVIGSSRLALEDYRSMLLSGRFGFSLAACASDVLSRVQPLHLSTVWGVTQAFSQHLRQFLFIPTSRFVHQKLSEKPVASSFQKPNNSFNRTAKKRPFSLRPPRVAAG